MMNSSSYDTNTAWSTIEFVLVPPQRVRAARARIRSRMWWNGLMREFHPAVPLTTIVTVVRGAQADLDNAAVDIAGDSGRGRSDRGAGGIAPDVNGPHSRLGVDTATELVERLARTRLLDLSSPR